MFESLHTIHWLKSGPLAIVWTAANLHRENDLRSKLNRKKCVKFNFDVLFRMFTCYKCSRVLLTTEVPLSFCLSSRLMLGIARIHQRQTHFALIDSEYLKRRFEVLSAIDLDFYQARPDQITFPEPDFNASFSSISDFQAFNFTSSSPMVGYFEMELEVDKGLINATSPLPRCGSIRGTPPADESFIADPRDISIEEGEAVNHSLETSLIDSMYFGDEDPMLITPERNLQCPPAAGNLQSRERKEDLVLLFDDGSNSFSFSDGGGAADISSSVIESPLNEPTQRETLVPMVFESPFINKKSSSHLSRCDPPASSRYLIDSLKQEQSHHAYDCREPNAQLKKKRRRKREKLSPLDNEITLSHQEMNAGASSVTVHTRKLDLRSVERPKLHKPKDLLFQMYTEPDTSLKLSKSLVQPALVIEKSASHEFTLESLQPFQTLKTTSTTTTQLVGGNRSDDSVSPSFQSELEVVRGGSHLDDLSYDNHLTNASAISGDTTIRSSRANSFQISTALRLRTDLESKDTQNLPSLLVTGGLSPIIDMDEDIRNMSGSSVGAMPDLDDSIDYQWTPQGLTRLPSSPFIERSPKTFAKRVKSTLESKKQIKFKDLLPEGSTRKTAGIAFHHILTILSKSNQLDVEQTLPYGPIILKNKSLDQSSSKL